MDSKLLELLVCPVTRGRLIYDATRSELISRGAKLAYPIRDGVPVMLEDEARKLNDNDLAATQDPARHHFQPD
ncbi:MAG: Trm112 family protein [Burkholderiales bacterium]|nr:Trm112 family protein [Burkholderiales bacterium]